MSRYVLLLSFIFFQEFVPTPGLGQRTITIPKSRLLDKIKGGWAGQAIGCTYGGPTEFRFRGSMIQDYHPIPWYDGYIKKTMTELPGLYDDLYMDLTFVKVFEQEGLDAPVSSFARAYAHADYWLWHANQIGRYNVARGLTPPQSGHWLNNPQADAIDYQIEADFAGLMSPGMPNTASEISDKIGHIMNYGDGWYGGVFVGAMYSLAFTSSDVNFIVREALKTIPKQSDFHRCIADVIRWHGEYPADWKRTWFECEKKWSSDRSVPEGVFDAFNIDASINAAYIVIGLLYGGGDFGKTIDIATRCGQDSDCNPASAGGILGTMLGYDRIPARWKWGLREAEDMAFKYTTMSLNDAYRVSFGHALKNIERQGGTLTGDLVTIVSQSPRPVRLERSFEGHYPTEKRGIYKNLEGDASGFEIPFEGIGFTLNGEARRNTGIDAEYVFRVDVFLNNEKLETIDLPTAFRDRRFNLAWKYQLPRGRYTLRIKVLNPSREHHLHLSYLMVFDEKPSADQKSLPKALN